ncbi:MAG: hypothetical protein WDM79_12170 [Terricaulis sp.]
MKLATLGTLCAVLALSLGACATVDQRVIVTPPEADAPAALGLDTLAPTRASLETERLFKTSGIWSDGGSCQGITEAEMSADDDATRLAVVRGVLSLCSRALMNQVLYRLNGRGNLATATSVPTFIAVAGGARAAASTTNAWLWLASIPIFYEDLQSNRMTAVEYYAGYGVAWVSEQTNALDRGFRAVHAQREILEDTVDRANAAGAAIRTQLDAVDRELAPLAANAPTRARLATTREKLQSLLAQLQATQAAARIARNSANAALAQHAELPRWARERFEQVRAIAIGQQIVSRVGPSEAFRTLLAAPFTILSDGIRGGSSTDAPRLVVQQNIALQFATLPKPMGIADASRAEVVDITFDSTTITDATRANLVAGHVSTIQELVEAVRTTRAAIAELATIDKATAPNLTLPAGNQGQ